LLRSHKNVGLLSHFVNNFIFKCRVLCRVSLFLSDWIRHFMNTGILKATRKAKRMKQDELCKHLGISRELFGKYESGKSSPRADLLSVWCEYLDLELRIITKI